MRTLPEHLCGPEWSEDDDRRAALVIAEVDLWVSCFREDIETHLLRESALTKATERLRAKLEEADRA